MDKIKTILQNLTNKKFIYLTYRGNDSIKQVVDLYPDKLFLIQDQGGWITYKKYPKQFQELKTKQTLIDLELLKKSNNSILLLNSLSGYFTEQPMQKINRICKQNKIILINDVAGSIGSENAKYGDFIVGSFNSWKPINLGYGGFIATNKKIKFKETFENKYSENLYRKMLELPVRLKYLHSLCHQVKTDLSGYKIINPEHESLVVIIKYETEKQKSEIIKYCNNNHYEYQLCPKYIRVNEQAISIEIKRK